MSVELEKCLLRNNDTVDSTSLNNCFSKLFDRICEVNGGYVLDTSDNMPSLPYFKDGYNEFPLCDSASSAPYMRKYGLVSSTSGAYGLVERMYGGSPYVEQYGNRYTTTESTTGAFTYEAGYVKNRFVPSVNVLYNTDYPLIFASLLGDETSVMYANGTATLDSTYRPTVKYTSYLLCSGIGISFGTVEFTSENGKSQSNAVVFDVVKDLIHIDGVRSIKFVSFGNGVGTGIRTISEDLDMVEGMCSAKVTALDGKWNRIAVSDITKNDASETIRVDKTTGRILDETEEAEFGTYTTLSNDTYSISFFVVFEYETPSVAFNNGSIALGIDVTESDYYAFMMNRTELNGEPLTLDDFEILDNYNMTSRMNVVTNATRAFYGCTNARFGKLNQFSDVLTYAESCFEGCVAADFGMIDGLYLGYIKNARRMFAGCTKATFANMLMVNAPIADDISEMFYGCSNASFRRLDSVYACGNVSKMFKNCRTATFNGLRDIRGGISKAESMFDGCDNAVFGTLSGIRSTCDGTADFTNMFRGCAKGTFDSLRTIGAANGYSADYMFNGCTNVNPSKLRDIGGIRSAKWMFGNCGRPTFEALMSLGSGTLADASHMFDGCSSAVITLTGAAGMGGLASVDGMFDGCSSVSINENSGMPSLVTADKMFRGCGTVTISSDMNRVTRAEAMFAECERVGLHGDMPRLVEARDMFRNTDVVYVDSNLSSVRTATDMFNGCGSVNICENTDFSSLSDGGSMFTSSDTVHVHCNLPSLRNAERMFSNCGHVTLDGTVPSLSGCDEMFYGCTEVDIPNVSLGGIIRGNGMFRECGSISLSGSLSSLCEADSMFQQTDDVSISGSVGNAIRSAAGMFSDCASVFISSLSDGGHAADYSHAFYCINEVSVKTLSDTFFRNIGNGESMFFDSEVHEFGWLGPNTSELRFDMMANGRKMFAKNDRIGFDSMTGVTITVPNGAPSSDYSGMFSDMDPYASLSSLKTLTVSSPNFSDGMLDMSKMFSNEGVDDTSGRLAELKDVSITTAGTVDLRYMFCGNEYAFANGRLSRFACSHSYGSHTSPQCGYSRRMFSGCTNMWLKPERLLLPQSPSVDDETECYQEMFYGVNVRNIDFSMLTESTTNIHKLGYSGRRTDGLKLFKGMVGLDELTAADVSKKTGLKLAIAEAMDWGIREETLDERPSTSTETPSTSTETQTRTSTYVPVRIDYVKLWWQDRYRILTGCEMQYGRDLVTSHSRFEIEKTTAGRGWYNHEGVVMEYPSTYGVSAYFDGDDKTKTVHAELCGHRRGEGCTLTCSLKYFDESDKRWKDQYAPDSVGFRNLGDTNVSYWFYGRRGRPDKYDYAMGKTRKGIRYCITFYISKYASFKKGRLNIGMR